MTERVYLGRSTSGGSPIELAVARWSKPGRVPREALKKLHGLRVNKRAAPVVLAVVVDDASVVTFGPNADAAPLDPLELEQAERLFQAVLDEPTPLLARARLAALSQAIDSTAIPGVKNSGLFANHELRVGVPQRPDWEPACASSTMLLVERGPGLISKLGYSVQRAGAHALVLKGNGPRPQAIAVMLEEREMFDAESPRFSISPVAYGLRMAEQEGVPWLLMARGSQLRLYPARVDLGVGRKGLAETFLEVDLPHLTAANAGYLSLLFSADALAEGGTTFQIMEASTQYAVALGERLRDKVYEEIIPELSLSVADQMIELGYEMDTDGLDLAYQITLRIFFRMLFQVYAEDRKLLPYKENDKYTRHALKTLAADFVENPDEQFDADSTSLWDDLAQVWAVIDKGDRAWNVPAYNGGLFTADETLNAHGHLIDQLRLTNDVMGPILKALLLDDNEDGTPGPIDFRSLSVREFGTIYEGLLESSLGLAEVDLTLDDKGTWLPAKKKSDDIYAYAGQVYFHNTSGQRKGTGSYFTPSFVVEHLLERALDPALDDHLGNVADLLNAGDQAGAADLFFDFKVADLAMGSGHFLTAAIDHIEAKMAAFLAEDGHQIPGVSNELAALLHAAKEAVGPDAPEPEPSSLLRRQIARRCVYGLDINPIAVELARVSIWIHTFVRGLPMSSLDHNLVCANSLTGIGSVEEALEVLTPGNVKGEVSGQISAFEQPIRDALERARTVLVDIANLPELNRKDSQAASRAVRKAHKEAEVARLLFDAAVLRRIGHADLAAGLELQKIAHSASSEEAQSVLAPLQPAHMPVLFPEVFLRDNSGFDVLIGNPPWEELMLDEVKFWLRVSPGLMGRPIAERRNEIARLRRSRPDLVPVLEEEIEGIGRIRAALLAGPFPGLGTGDVDLYRVFAWRNWRLIRKMGRVGAVFPRTLLNAAGNTIWRETVLSEGEVSVVTVVNKGGWIFPNVDGRYSITFIDIQRKTPENGYGTVSLSGPFFDLVSFDSGWPKFGQISSKVIQTASEGGAFPQLPSAESAIVFEQIRRSPRLDEGVAGARFLPVRELDATLDRSVFDAGARQDHHWPVYGGASFNLWNPETGEVFAWADPTKVQAALQAKRRRQVKLKTSAFLGMGDDWASDEATLPCQSPRIAYRQITNATNTRTVIAALVPGCRVITNAAPYLFMREGSAQHESYLVGVMSSIPFDWYARRFVELNFNFHIVNGMPIPTLDLAEARCRRVVQVAGRLAARDDRFASWAEAVGIPVGSVKTPDQQAEMEAELDALVSHLYGLSRDQMEHIFATFHRGWDYQPRLDAVLAHFDRIAGQQ